MVPLAIDLCGTEKILRWRIGEDIFQQAIAVGYPTEGYMHVHVHGYVRVHGVAVAFVLILVYCSASASASAI